MEKPEIFFRSLITSKFSDASEIINTSPYQKMGTRMWFSINERDKSQILEVQVSENPARFEIVSYRMGELHLAEFKQGGFPQIHWDKKMTLSGTYNDEGRLTVTGEIDPHHGAKTISRIGYSLPPEDLFMKICESYLEAF